MTENIPEIIIMCLVLVMIIINLIISIYYLLAYSVIERRNTKIKHVCFV